MRATPIPAEPTPTPREDNAQHYLRVLHGLIDLGASLAQRIQQQPVNHAEQTAAGIEPSAEPAAAVSVEFDRTVRGVRRSILLAQHIQNPAPARAAAGPAQHPTLVRQRILRVVEDEIHDKLRGEAADALRRELLDRLDTPELEDEIGTRSADEIILDIKRDLGIAGVPGYHHPWKRRTPEDVADLHARAAGRPLPPTPSQGAGTEPHARTAIPAGRRCRSRGDAVAWRAIIQRVTGSRTTPPTVMPVLDTAIHGVGSVTSDEYFTLPRATRRGRSRR